MSVQNWIARSTIESPTKQQTSPTDPPMDMPSAIWQILRNRGLTQAEVIEKILNPRLRELAHPFSLDEMDRAVQRLIDAFKNQEPILLYGDYDLDGTPGIVLLREGLEKLGFTHLFTFQPSRKNDGYGVHAQKVLQFAEKGIRLVVTVDVGITDNEAVDQLREAGIEVIVTDHHLPKEILPKAHAVVNPNKGTCGSQLQHLCGTGVAFYLILALRIEMERQKLLKLQFDAKELLDLFALATITDMVPLVNENRVLVKHGLKMLAKTERPGLRLLLGELGLYGRDLTAQDVSFRLAPKLNALTRLEEGITAFDILTADHENARARVEQAIHINDRRRVLQAQALDVARTWLRTHFDPSRDQIIFVYSSEFHPGVISLVASDLASDYGIPTFVGAVREDGRVVGSARAPSVNGGQDINLQDILRGADSLLTRFGGHRYAAGFEVDCTKADELRDVLNATMGALAQKSKDRNFDDNITVGHSGAIYYDAELRLNDFSHRFMSWHDALGPFGPGFDAPIYLMRGLRVQSVRKLKNKYLRYTLTDGLNDLEAPWFQNPFEFEKGTKIDFIFEPQWNDYNGRRTLQARILAARAHQPSRSIESEQIDINS